MPQSSVQQRDRREVYGGDTDWRYTDPRLPTPSSPYDDTQAAPASPLHINRTTTVTVEVSSRGPPSPESDGADRPVRTSCYSADAYTTAGAVDPYSQQGYRASAGAVSGQYTYFESSPSGPPISPGSSPPQYSTRGTSYAGDPVYHEHDYGTTGTDDAVYDYDSYDPMPMDPTYPVARGREQDRRRPTRRRPNEQFNPYPRGDARSTSREQGTAPQEIWQTSKRAY